MCGLTIAWPASAPFGEVAMQAERFSDPLRRATDARRRDPESRERGWRRFEPAFDPAEAVSLDRLAGRVYRLIDRRGPMSRRSRRATKVLEV